MALAKYCLWLSRVAGWFNLLGQVAVTAGIEYSLANQARRQPNLMSSGFTVVRRCPILAPYCSLYCLINDFLM